MPIKVHGLELQALFDTGSDGSVISTRVWEMFPDEERPELRPGDRPIEGPSGNIVEQEGEQHEEDGDKLPGAARRHVRF